MDQLSLNAGERMILGKKVKRLRSDGKLPAHVFGKKVDNENVVVDAKDFLKIFHLAGETGLINLKIGEEKVKPVLVRGVQYDPVSGNLVHIDFYQVNLSEKVKVPVPLVLIGEEPESVKLGETIVLQTLSEVEVEALPADLVEKIEIDIATLKNIDDAITVGQLSYDKEKLTLSASDEEIVVKLAPAVTDEMQKQMEEEAVATAADQAETTGEEGAEVKEGEETEVKEGGSAPEGGEQPGAKEEKPSGG